MLSSDSSSNFSNVAMDLRAKFPIIDIDSHFDNSEYSFDALVIVSFDIDKQSIHSKSYLNEFVNLLKQYKECDEAFSCDVTFLTPAVRKYEGIKKLIHSPTGCLGRHYDDVRRFADATKKGIERALKAGSKRILLAVLDYSTSDKRQVFDSYREASLLAAAHSIYVPLEVREGVPHKAEKVEILGFSSNKSNYDFEIAVELGRIACRDIGGSDPERMAASNVAKYVQSIFSQNSSVKIEIIDDDNVLQKEYPLLSAVNRCAKGVERHRGCVIFLTYDSNDQPDKTLFLVGKGITYDTGGSDLKTGGHMYGMHRDKCGAAAVAGFFQTLDRIRPSNIKVVGAMTMVRNSIGSDAYVCDEIITSRSGARVRIVNTDAEGRMVMADLLCHMREKAVDAVNPHLFTIATLTGHAVLAVGPNYSIIADNGPAEAENVAPSIQQAGSKVGDMFEISTLRCEDYAFNDGKSEYEDLMQTSSTMSSVTERGHQFPAAFLIRVSGLDKHDINSTQPLKYSHIDIAGSSGPFPGVPTGAPIPALAYHFLK